MATPSGKPSDSSRIVVPVVAFLVGGVLGVAVGIAIGFGVAMALIAARPVPFAPPRYETVPVPTDELPELEEGGDPQPEQGLRLDVPIEDIPIEPEPPPPPEPRAPEVGAVRTPRLWFERTQEEDGRWDSRKWGGEGNDLRATSLATLCFLGAGYRPDRGRFKDEVRLGLSWLAGRQGADGRFGGGTFLDHGIASLVFVEAYARTHDAKLKARAQRGIDCIVATQPDHGGFGPNGAAERDKGDLHVTSWQILAVRAADDAGLDVPDRVIERFRAFLKSVERDDGKSAPSPDAEAGGPAVWAMGLCSRLMLGATAKETRAAAAALLEQTRAPQEGGPQGLLGDLGLVFFGTVGLKYRGGEDGSRWFRIWHRRLCDAQTRERRDASGADVRGSWDPARYALPFEGGRVEATALAILSLETPYRFLSIYAPSEPAAPPASSGPPRLRPPEGGIDDDENE